MLQPRVIVVEDDAALRSVLVRGLEEEGFSCRAVATGGVSSTRSAPVTLATTVVPACSTRRGTEAVVVWPWSQTGGASRRSSQR